jgi:hypothetical protein
MEAAAGLLGLAADCLLSGNDAQARSYLEKANMLTLRTYTHSIASQTTREIHRFRNIADLAAAVPIMDRGRRQPSSAIALDIFRRDGFRCRYCGCRIVSPRAQSVISAQEPRRQNRSTLPDRRARRSIAFRSTNLLRRLALLTGETSTPCSRCLSLALISACFGR